MINDGYTIGEWATEVESAAAFDNALARVALWNVYHEVKGTLIQPRAGQQDKTVRIDRVLVPNERLIAAGWKQGIVGVEIKRSGEKIGPPIAQAMDYGRAVWTLSQAGIRVWLDWVFIWPMEKQHGPVASILAQNRIGSAKSDQWRPLHLCSGEQNILRVRPDGTFDLGAATNGQKVGRR